MKIILKFSVAVLSVASCFSVAQASTESGSRCVSEASQASLDLFIQEEVPAVFFRSDVWVDAVEPLSTEDSSQSAYNVNVVHHDGYGANYFVLLLSDDCSVVSIQKNNPSKSLSFANPIR